MTAWGLRLSDQKKTTLSRRGSTVATAPSIRVEYIFRAPPSRCNRETERAPVLYPDNWPGSSSCLSNRWPWHTCRLRWDCQHVWRSDSPLPGNRPPWHSSCRKCCIDPDCHCHDSCLPSPQESRGCCKERQLCAVVRVWEWPDEGLEVRRGRSHSVSPDDPVSPVPATLLPHTGLTVTEQMLLLLQSLHLHKDVLPLLCPEEVVNDANPKLVQMFNNNRDRLVQPASI